MNALRGADVLDMVKVVRDGFGGSVGLSCGASWVGQEQGVVVGGCDAKRCSEG